MSKQQAKLSFIFAQANQGTIAKTSTAGDYVYA
jgi:hypothetical protein